MEVKEKEEQAEKQEEQVVKTSTEIKPGDKFVAGSQYGYPMVVFGRDPESKDAPLKRAIPEDALLIKLTETTRISSSQIQAMFGKDKDGNYYVENLSGKIPMRINSSNLKEEQILEPEKKIALGDKVEVLKSLSIQWGDKYGAITHKLDVDSYGATSEGNWQATFKYFTQSLL